MIPKRNSPEEGYISVTPGGVRMDDTWRYKDSNTLSLEGCTAILNISCGISKSQYCLDLLAVQPSRLEDQCQDYRQVSSIRTPPSVTEMQPLRGLFVEDALTWIALAICKRFLNDSKERPQ